MGTLFEGILGSRTLEGNRGSRPGCVDSKSTAFRGLDYPVSLSRSAASKSKLIPRMARQTHGYDAMQAELTNPAVHPWVCLAIRGPLLTSPTQNISWP